MTYNMIKTPMADLVKAAQESLKYQGLEADGKGGIKVRLILDHSTSMRPWYRAGAVQRLTEQVLGLAAALDDDGTIEVWYFASGVSKMFEVSLKPTDSNTMAGTDPYYLGWVTRTHSSQPWGSTNYTAALQAPVDFQRSQGETEPALVIFQTDGGPNNPITAAEKLKELSGDKTFFSFVVFGDTALDGEEPTDVEKFMQTLDRMPGRIRDNADVYFTGPLEEYAESTDLMLYDEILGEFIGGWLPTVL